MKIIQVVSLAMALTVLPACSTFEVEGNGFVTPEAMVGSETVHGSLYGIDWTQRSTEKCGADSLFRVEYHTNAAFLLASVASLGLYVPQTVQWWCYSPTESEEDEEVWDPTAGVAGGVAP
ncbi:MAG: hypothetical protein AB8G16_00970 [Gammaproteobacteria bacterium]